MLASLTEEKRQEALVIDPRMDVGDINVTLDNPADEIYNSADQTIANLIGTGNKQGNITLTDYYSHRTSYGQINTGMGKYATNIINEAAADILFYTYLFEKLGYYQNLKTGSHLDYQIEYLIFGENMDDKNLQRVKKRIFNWRLADNVRLYFTDNAKYREAMAIALAITAVIAHPQLAKPVAYSILFSWAFADSIEDSNKIFDGGKVPLIKTSIGSTENGLLYHEYLKLMLLLVGEKKLLSRTMDVIEMDIRLTANNQNFHIDWCLESFRATLGFYDRYENYSIDRYYGYY
jgi:hypothetical protein